MTLQERIVEEARSWKGTRFQHQGQLKGVGVDCAHFVALVARDAGIDIEIPHDYRPREDGRLMKRLLEKHMEGIPIEERQAGDVLALCDESLRDPNVPRHLAFVSEVTHTTFIVHASERGVLEHRMNSWWLKRIHSCWRLKNDI